MSFSKTTAAQELRHAVSYVGTGRNAELEKQLIKKSFEDNIVRYTPKDAKKRFGSQEMLESWLKKGREIHWLIGPDNDLAGIIWYGVEEFPAEIELKQDAPTHTFAIRLYDGYVGKGLAKPFMKQSLCLLLESARTPIGIWLQTDVDNVAARKAYTSFGYVDVDENAERVTMILPADTATQVCD